MSNSVQRKSSELTKAKKTLKQAEKRITELDKLFTRLYEDNVLGRLSDERFTIMSAGYEEEQAKLKATVAELTAFVETAEQKSSDVTAFLKVVHKYELIKAKNEGYHTAIAFVIQMDGVKEVRANIDTHPEFVEALNEAKKAGVKVLFFPCHVEPDSLVITEIIEGKTCK